MSDSPAADLPPYDPQRLLSAPFPERVRLVCRSWAAQVAPTPLIVMAIYWLKYLVLLVGGWSFFVSFDAGYPGFTSPGGWAFTAVAFQKALLWAIVYELTGLGCGFGPMNARFNPPFGGILHFLRPGTTKLALFPNAPLIGGIRRTWLDVALYAANHLFLLRALVAPDITPALLWPSVLLIPLMGIGDKTLFLAARGSASSSGRPSRCMKRCDIESASAMSTVVASGSIFSSCSRMVPDAFFSFLNLCALPLRTSQMLYAQLPA